MRSARSRPRPGSPGPTSAEQGSQQEAAATRRTGLDRLADRWSALVLDSVQRKAKRFTELRSDLEGISEKMLTQTLRSLERDGMIARKDFGVVPPHVEYSITELGRSLTVTLSVMCDWSRQHQNEIEEARARYDGERGN